MITEDTTNQIYIEELIKELGTAKDDFNGFDNLVDLMASKGKPVFYYNNLPRQTKKVLTVILTKAKKCNFLKMFIGDINCEFYGIDILRRLEEVAQSDCALDIVLADRPSDKILDEWKRLEHNKTHVFYKHSYDEKLNHIYFTEDAYRIEASHPKLLETESVTDIYPRRPARFGFYIPEDIEALKTIWKNNVLPNISPIHTLGTKIQVVV